MIELLVVEDGDEYAQFVARFLPDLCVTRSAHGAAEALAELARQPAQALLLDLRFERSAASGLLGDIEATARRLFGGDRDAALSYLRDQQGALILAELRSAGHEQPALFIHDFPEARLGNLRRLYGEVHAIDTFDARALRALLCEVTGT